MNINKKIAAIAAAVTVAATMGTRERGTKYSKIRPISPRNSSRPKRRALPQSAFPKNRPRLNQCATYPLRAIT